MKMSRLSGASKPPAGEIRKPRATTPPRRLACRSSSALTALVFAGFQAWLLVVMVAVIGYLLPDLLLARATRAYQKSIQNGLPDALDLIVVCVEAGSSLDQAIVRASEELEIALPALAQELRTVTGEIRAGKPRSKPFTDLPRRTQLDDVRALVAMLTQTDRFGTSIAQALRTHAATSARSGGSAPKSGPARSA